MMLQLAIALALQKRVLILPIVGVVLGLVCLYRGLQTRARKRIIQRIPASRIRSASMGPVEVNGLSTGPYVMLSPVKRVPCYYYRTVVSEWQGGENDGDWVQVAEEILHVPFYLDDGTDKLLVDARGAEVELQSETAEEYDRSTPAEEAEIPWPVTEFLARQNISTNKRVRLEEYCIKPHDSLFVLGTLSQNPGIDASIAPSWAERVHKPSASPVTKKRPVQRVVPEIIHLSAEAPAVPVTEMTQQQKIAAALMKAGMHKLTVWNPEVPVAVPVQHTAAQAAPAIEEQPPTPAVHEVFDLHPPVVLMKGTQQPAFFISWRSRREIVTPLNWKDVLMLCGGPAIIVAALCSLVLQFRR